MQTSFPSTSFAFDYYFLCCIFESAFKNWLEVPNFPIPQTCIFWMNNIKLHGRAFTLSWLSYTCGFRRFRSLMLFTHIYGVFESLMMFINSFLIIWNYHVKLMCLHHMPGTWWTPSFHQASLGTSCLLEIFLPSSTKQRARLTSLAARDLKNSQVLQCPHCSWCSWSLQLFTSSTLFLKLLGFCFGF